MQMSMFFWWGAMILFCALYALVMRIKWKRKVRFLREDSISKKPEWKKKYLNGKLRPILERVGDPDIIGIVECKQSKLAYLAATKKSLIYIVFDGEGEKQIFQFSEMQDIKMKTWGIHWVPVKKLSFIYHGEQQKFSFSISIAHLPDSMALRYIPQKDFEKIMILFSQPFVEKISSLMVPGF
jgi:hypothetical protein